MYYQLFEYSKERMSRYPLNKKFILVFSLSEKALQVAVKRIKKSDPGAKEITQVQESRPKVNDSDCVLVSGTQEDVEAYYKV